MATERLGKDPKFKSPEEDILDNDFEDEDLNPTDDELSEEPEIDSYNFSPTVDTQGDPEDLTSAQLFFIESCQHPLLTHQEEIQLAKEIERGEFAKAELASLSKDDPMREYWLDEVQVGKRAYQKLMECNQKLVASVARRHLGRGLPFMDLVQEGNIGMSRGIKKYDYRRGFRFSTYAYWWIRQGMSRAIADQSRTIRMPVHAIEALTHLGRAESDLTGRKEKVHVSDEDLAKELARRYPKGNWTVDTVRNLKSSSKIPISLNSVPAENGDDEVDLSDLVADQLQPDVADMATDNSFALQIRKSLEDLVEKEVLKPNELRVLMLRYGLEGDKEMTLAEIGEEMGFSRERARQNEMTALRKLRANRDLLRMLMDLTGKSRQAALMGSNGRDDSSFLKPREVEFLKYYRNGDGNGNRLTYREIAERLGVTTDIAMSIGVTIRRKSKYNPRAEDLISEALAKAS